MNGKRLKIHQGKRYKVKVWIAPESMRRIAIERTNGMCEYFLSNASREGLKWWDQLHILVESAYMQGLNDAIDTIKNMPK